MGWPMDRDRLFLELLIKSLSPSPMYTGTFLRFRSSSFGDDVVSGMGLEYKF